MTPDENVKIYSNPNNPNAPKGEAERSAQLYMQHKQNGNLQQCTLLGQYLATAYLKIANQLNGSDHFQRKVVLVAFLMDLQLQHVFPDTILLKSIQSTRNKVLEQESKELMNILRASTSDFSLYMLDDRKGSVNATAQTFAHLCGDLTNKKLLQEASDITNQCNQLFADMIAAISGTIIQVNI